MTTPLTDITPPSKTDKALARLGGLTGTAGVALALIGLLVIGLGWNAAAEKITTVQQMPYLLSAGFFGLGLVVLGAGILVADSHRRDRQEITVRLEALIDAQAGTGAVPGLAPGVDGFAPLPRVPAGR